MKTLPRAKRLHILFYICILFTLISFTDAFSETKITNDFRIIYNHRNLKLSLKESFEATIINPNPDLDYRSENFYKIETKYQFIKIFLKGVTITDGTKPVKLLSELEETYLISRFGDPSAQERLHSLFKTVLKIYPKDKKETQYNLGLLYLRMDRISGAIKYFKSSADKGFKPSQQMLQKIKDKPQDIFLKTNKPDLNPIEQNKKLTKAIKDLNSTQLLSQIHGLTSLLDMDNNPLAINELIKKTFDKSEKIFIRTLAIHTLGKIGHSDKKSILKIIEALQSDNEMMRRAAAFAIGRADIAFKDIVYPSLTAAFLDKSPAVSDTAKLSYELLESQEKFIVSAIKAIKAKEELINLLIDDLGSNRLDSYKSVNDLIKIGKPAVPYLIEKYKKNNKTAGAIALVLMKIGKPAAPALKEAIQNPKKFELAFLVFRDQGAQSIPYFIYAFEKLKNINHRCIVGAQLALFGPAAKSAIPVFEKAVNDENENIRKISIEALKRINIKPSSSNGNNDISPKSQSVSIDKANTKKVKAGANINHKNSWGVTTLVAAIKSGQTDIVRLLVKNKANVNEKNFLYRTPLHHAASFNQLEIAAFLISKGADVNYTDILSKATPLHNAANKGFAEMVRLLAKSGAKIDKKNKFGKTPLHLASSEGHLKAVEELIKFNANKNAQNNKGQTPLYSATELGRTEIVKVLLQVGADPNVVNSSGAKPLHLAALLDRKSILDSLLKKCDRTALDNKDKEVIDKLQSARRAKMESDHRSFNVPYLFSAAGNGDIDKVRKLLEAGMTNVNLHRGAGDTALHGAVKNGHESIVVLLLDKGADPNARFFDLGKGKTPIHIAAQEGRPAILKLLLEHGADVNARTKNGETALHFATRKNRTKVVHLLINSGANTTIQGYDDRF